MRPPVVARLRAPWRVFCDLRILSTRVGPRHARGRQNPVRANFAPHAETMVIPHELPGVTGCVSNRSRERGGGDVSAKRVRWQSDLSTASSIWRIRRQTTGACVWTSLARTRTGPRSCWARGPSPIPRPSPRSRRSSPVRISRARKRTARVETISTSRHARGCSRRSRRASDPSTRQPRARRPLRRQRSAARRDARPKPHRPCSRELLSQMGVRQAARSRVTQHSRDRCGRRRQRARGAPMRPRAHRSQSRAV